MTLLPGTSSTLASTRTAYLPREKYWSVRYCFDLVEHRLVEGLAGGETDVAQRLLQVLGLDVLVALDLEALDRRPLEHRDHQRAALAADLDVAEEPVVVQRACSASAHAALVEPVADVDRQVVVNRAFGDALQAFDADVADGELPRRCGEARVGHDLRRGWARTAPAAASASVAWMIDFKRIGRDPF